MGGLLEAENMLGQTYEPEKPGKVVLVSGGLDSYVTLMTAVRQPDEGLVYPLAFDYGQKCIIELEYAKKQIAHVKRVTYSGSHVQPLYVMSISGMLGSSMLNGSDADPAAREDDIDLPSATNVPNRNAVFLSLAYGMAEALGVGQVWAGLTDTGAHGGPTPDARKEFVDAIQLACRLGSAAMTQERRSPRFITPLSDIPTKLGALMAGDLLGITPVHVEENVWSCFSAGPKPCGKCRACIVLSKAKELLPFAHELARKRRSGEPQGR